MDTYKQYDEIFFSILLLPLFPDITFPDGNCFLYMFYIYMFLFTYIIFILCFFYINFIYIHYININKYIE